MKNVLSLLVFGVASVLSSAQAGENVVELNQCQRKALMAVQIKANPKFDTYVVLKSIRKVATPDVLDEVTYTVDVDLGTPDVSRFVRYKAYVLIDRSGSCAGSDAAQAKFVKNL